MTAGGRRARARNPAAGKGITKSDVDKAGGWESRAFLLLPGPEMRRNISPACVDLACLILVFRGLVVLRARAEQGAVRMSTCEPWRGYIVGTW